MSRIRTQKDIQRDQAENDLRIFKIGLLEKYQEIDIRDLCVVLSSQLTYELSAMNAHYELEAKD